MAQSYLQPGAGPSLDFSGLLGNGTPNALSAALQVLTAPVNAPDYMHQAAGWIARGGKPTPAAPAPVDWTFGGGPGTPLPMGGLSVNSIIGPESGGNPNAANPRSSATGLGQFLDKTWNDPDLKARAGYANVPDDQWKKLKQGQSGVSAQIAMTQAYAQRNSEHWQAKYGTTPTQGELYGMHFLDGSGFTDLVDKAQSDPTADASLIFPQAAKANPGVFYNDPKTRKSPKTAAQLVDTLTHLGGDTTPFQMPALQGIDPQAAMAAMPNPTKPALLDDREVPQLGESPPRPPEEQIDVQGWMDKLKAFAPKSFDEKAANEGRVGAVLAGMAKGASSADARLGLGNMLASIGAGAGAVATDWDQHVKAEKKTTEEAQRLFELGVARQGLELGDQNRQIRGRNIEAKWQDQRDKVLNSYTNEKNQFDQDTKVLLANNGLLNEYGRDMYQAAVNRARVGLQATEFNTQLTNQQLTGQAELDLKRFIFEDEKSAKAANDGQMKTVMSMANAQGMNPALVIQNKDHVGLNALQGMAYIAAQNKPAAIGALARELVLTQSWDQLPPSLTKNLPMIAKQDPELAASIAARALNEAEADPKTRGSALNVARAMAARGHPLAATFMNFAQPKGTPGG